MGGGDAELRARASEWRFCLLLLDDVLNTDRLKLVSMMVKAGAGLGVYFGAVPIWDRGCETVLLD